MNSELFVFYIYIFGLLAAFTFSFVVVITLVAIREKLKGGEFFKTLHWCWDNC